jgi:hypothetical protein
MGSLSTAGDHYSPEITRQVHLTREPFIRVTGFSQQFDLFPAGGALVVSVFFAAQRTPRHHNRSASFRPDLPTPSRQTHGISRRVTATSPYRQAYEVGAPRTTFRCPVGNRFVPTVDSARHWIAYVRANHWPQLGPRVIDYARQRSLFCAVQETPVGSRSFAAVSRASS